MKFLPNFNTSALFGKVIPAAQETLTSYLIIHKIIFYFTDGEGLSVNFRYFLLYHKDVYLKYEAPCALIMRSSHTI